MSLPLVESDFLLYFLRPHTCPSSPISGSPSRLPSLPSTFSDPNPLLLPLPFYSLLLPLPFYSLHVSSWQTFWALLLITSVMPGPGDFWMTTPFWTPKVEKEEVSEETRSGGEGRPDASWGAEERQEYSIPAQRREHVCWSVSAMAHGFHLTSPVPCSFPVPSGPPSTTILASANKVKGGDDISILCTVLGEPDVEVEFRWIYPGQKVSIPRPQPAALLVLFPTHPQLTDMDHNLRRMRDVCSHGRAKAHLFSPKMFQYIYKWLFLKDRKKSDWVPLGNSVNVLSSCYFSS